MSANESTSKPGRMIVSLQVGGVFFALANVICVAILAWAYLSVKLEPKTIEVKGSAKKGIESDLITWSATITAKDSDLPKAYDKLKGDADKVGAFLKAAGIPEGEITFSQITTSKRYEKKEITPPSSGGITPPPQLVETDKVESYTLTQTVTVESHDMKRVPEVAAECDVVDQGECGD